MALELELITTSTSASVTVDVNVKINEVGLIDSTPVTTDVANTSIGLTLTAAITILYFYFLLVDI